jgi:hypothetical protein
MVAFFKMIVPLNALAIWQTFYGYITSVNDTRDACIASVVDTGDASITRISNTGNASDLIWFITGWYRLNILF